VSLTIIDTSTVPPENWSYLVSQTGVYVSTKNYSLLYGMVVDHCKANNVPVPSEQDVIDWMCNNLTIHCAEGSTPLINRFTLGLAPVQPKGCCGQQMPMPTQKESL
jgi:hypothetical protein